MTENQLLEKAAQICVSKHAGQTDKAGQPYFQHPMRVALGCDTAEQKIVALLHDTIEDTDVTPEYLLEQGFPQTIVDAVESVTKRDGESYEDFVARAASNPIGRAVKLRDLEDNLNVFRLETVDTAAAQRLTKYLAAYKFLKDFDSSDATDATEPKIEEPTQQHIIRNKSEYWHTRRVDENKNIRRADVTPKGSTNFNKDRIMVRMPDGKILAEQDAVDTFMHVISYFGYAEVEKLGIKYGEKYPLVARKNIAGRYKEATGGWYVLSNCPNTKKAIYINQLADEFDLPILAEIIAK